jgi:hypothetical protein
MSSGKHKQKTAQFVSLPYADAVRAYALVWEINDLTHDPDKVRDYARVRKFIDGYELAIRSTLRIMENRILSASGSEIADPIEVPLAHVEAVRDMLNRFLEALQNGTPSEPIQNPVALYPHVERVCYKNGTMDSWLRPADAVVAEDHGIYEAMKRLGISTK